MSQEPRVFTASKIPKKEIPIDDIYAEFCYHYPQYKYHEIEALKIPYHRVIKMIDFAKKERLRFYRELVKIVSAPHIKGGKAGQSLIQSYTNQIGD